MGFFFWGGGFVGQYGGTYGAETCRGGLGNGPRESNHWQQHQEHRVHIAKGVEEPSGDGEQKRNGGVCLEKSSGCFNVSRLEKESDSKDRDVSSAEGAGSGEFGVISPPGKKLF